MADCETTSESEYGKLCVKPAGFQVEDQNDHTLNHKSSALPPSSISHNYTNMALSADSQLTSMFGPVPERCVTFCIDTSGSMFSALNVVKEQLLRTLYSLAARDDHPMFNLIEFNSHVTQWADKLIECTPEIVNVAKEWLSNLKAKTGTNTLDALLTALSDPDCQAVYLITDDTPDQQTEEVLDKVIGICGSRHIHCIYISGEATDETAAEFLEDLAVETFGSFTIVQLSNCGSILKIIPVYCSEPTHEKLVWTVNNTLRPNFKTCSVSTSLQLDPDEVLRCFSYAKPVLYNPDHLILQSSLLNTFPYHCCYPYYWSWHYPPKAWLKAHNRLIDQLFSISPAAGSLLLGKKIIARRLEDGYFYRGTIQNQNPGKSFLVAFGPSKHGKFKQTEYQDAFIFDIIDFIDALRHTIITGDRVLAPWEPEGDRFAPGIVIQGQEKRQMNGPDDHELTVSFSNGHIEKVPYDIAVWIPSSMYERLSLELKMSASARKILYSTVEHYPIKSLPGYPTANCSTESNGPDPLAESSSFLWNPALSWYPLSFLPFYGYPPYLIKQKVEKKKGRNSPLAVTCDEDSALIPNTGMTKHELDERVMMQLMEHRCSFGTATDVWHSGKMPNLAKVSTSPKSSRLLGKREKQEENNLNKHVHFETVEKNKEHSEQENEYYTDSDYDAYGNIIKKYDSAVNTDSSLLFYSSPGVGHRPEWKKFWRNEPSPSYNAINDGLGCVKSSSSVKPFKETALQAPLEAREQRNPPYNVEWASSAFKYVDTFAKHDCSNSVKECLSGSKPVSPHNERKIMESLPVANLTAEEREELCRENRRRRVLKREADWQEKLAEENNMKAVMMDHYRERILTQLERDRQRQIKEMVDIQQAREAKKKISAEFRARIESNQKEEADKEERRIVALSKKRERREQMEAQHRKEIQECIQRREQIRKQNCEVRMKANIERLDEEDIQAGKLDRQHHNAKLHRLHHFQKREKENQKKKDLQIAVAEQNLAINRSKIFP